VQGHSTTALTWGSDACRPSLKASSGLTRPAGRGRLQVRSIRASISLSNHILRMVLPLIAFVVFLGLFFDVVVYTIWLKRKSAWSIIFGGVSGGMPILAGRVLGTGQIDWIGIVLGASVLFWIPTHIMTFSMRYYKDYNAAGVPTFPSRYGFQKTRAAIAVSSVLTALTMAAAAYGVGLSWGYLRVLVVLSAGLFVLAFMSTIKPSKRLNFGLFKFASLYMLSAMVLMTIGGI